MRMHCECGKFMKQIIDWNERTLDASCVCGAKLHVKIPKGKLH